MKSKVLVIVCALLIAASFAIAGERNNKPGTVYIPHILDWALDGPEGDGIYLLWNDGVPDDYRDVAPTKFSVVVIAPIGMDLWKSKLILVRRDGNGLNPQEHRAYGRCLSLLRR
jgi:hypothetical protein